MSVSEMARGVHEEELASANAGGASGKEVVRKHGPAMPADLAHELSDDDFYRLVAWARLYSTRASGLGCPPPCCTKAFDTPRLLVVHTKCPLRWMYSFPASCQARVPLSNGCCFLVRLPRPWTCCAVKCSEVCILSSLTIL